MCNFCKLNKDICKYQIKKGAKMKNSSKSIIINNSLKLDLDFNSSQNDLLAQLQLALKHVIMQFSGLLPAVVIEDMCYMLEDYLTNQN